MVSRKAVLSVSIILLLVVAIPATVTAQAVPQNVLLDQKTTKMATVSIDDQSYTVYRIENVVWYASGIDIYANGDRVRSESTARAVLRKLARRRAAQRIGPDNIRTLRPAKQNVSDSQPAVSNATDDIQGTLDHLEHLKTRQVDGTTAYNRSVEAAPAITDFNESARVLLPELRSFETDSAAVVENATTLIELIQRRENGEPVDPQRLYSVYVATLRSIEAVDNHLTFDGGVEGLAELSTTSETIAANVSSVPETGNRTAKQFADVAKSTAIAANRTETIELPGFDFEQAQERAESLESDWLDQWESRQNAGKDVYNTIFGLIVVIVLLAVYFRWRRS